MKNQYTGDIGDYSKLGILRVIIKAGFSLGINWYLTPDDNKTDGKHVKYLKAPCDTPDKKLFDILHDIVYEKKSRSVKELETSGLLGNTVFYNEILDFSAIENRREKRELWHKKAVLELCTQDIIFLDPDNGFETNSISPYSAKGNKYVTYEEAAEYFNKGASVIIYSHKDRSPDEKYIERLRRIKNHIQKESDIFCIRASRFSARDYLFVTQPHQSKKIKLALDNMFSTGWNNYLSYKKLYFPNKNNLMKEIFCAYIPFFESQLNKKKCHWHYGWSVPKNSEKFAVEMRAQQESGEYMDGREIAKFAESFEKSGFIRQNYGELIEKHGLERSNELIHHIDTADLELTKAILTFFVRREHFCNGAWIEATENSAFLKCLCRLRDLL